VSRATYSGCCIGGPMAGQFAVFLNQSFRCTVGGAIVAPDEAMADLSPAVTTHHYLWVHMGPFAVWIHESLDFNQALNLLVETYVEKNHGKPTL